MRANPRAATDPSRVVVLLAVLLGMSGCNQFFGLADVELAPDEGNSYSCGCVCGIGNNQVVVERNVCLPDELNPILHPEVEVTAAELIDDCTMRVENNLRQMARQCIARTINCSCEASADLRFAFACDKPCVGEDLASDCSNFDPATGNKTATNVPGQAPVCFVPSTHPSNAAPEALAASIFGNSTLCDVAGDVTVARGDETKTAATSGHVDFSGTPCPGAQCQVGMAYSLDDIANLEFSGFAGFASVEFQNLEASGASVAGGATIDSAGFGSFAADSTFSSGSGRRSNQILGGETSSDAAGYAGTNGAPIDVVVDWQQSFCEVSGALLGSLEDADTSVSVALAGEIVNVPPTANAGPELASVECTSPAGATVTLAGTQSTDPDGNIAWFAWRRGGRAGEDIGSEPTLVLPQALGVTESYYLQVVDTLGQASADTTTVKVVDTTPPVVGEVTASPSVLWPPNHQMIPVTVAVESSDVCGASTCRIAAVSSNEPIGGPGTKHSPDWEIAGPLAVNLRAERVGRGSGRIYTLTVECSDPSGNGSTATAVVSVPHS
jgi:hypothetical protein